MRHIRNGGRDAGSDRYAEQYLYDLEADPYELRNLVGLAITRTGNSGNAGTAHSTNAGGRRREADNRTSTHAKKWTTQRIRSRSKKLISKGHEL